MPIRYEIEQNTEAWLEARAGIPTASFFSKILTPATCKLSASADEYIYALIAEKIIGHSQGFDTKWTERGHELEPKAVEDYELQTGYKTEPGGFYTNDTATAGASPDRKRVAEEKGLEVKCPSPHVHIETLIKGGLAKDHKCQVQGQLLVTGWESIDIISYCPGLPLHIETVDRDEDFIAKLDAALVAFNTRFNELFALVESQMILA